MADNGFTKAEVTLAKIVATPTLSAWAQAYNAGSLFAVLSLQQDATEKRQPGTLGELGKKIIDALEQEYYTLEEKNLASIAQAVNAAIATLGNQPHIKLSIAVGSVIQNVLYVFVMGNGRVLLQRGNKLGTILKASDSLEAASGFLQDSDTIIVETPQFYAIVPDAILQPALAGSPQETVEVLSPTIHGQDGGGTAALIVHYSKPQQESMVHTQEGTTIQDAAGQNMQQQNVPPTTFSLPIEKLTPLVVLLTSMFFRLTARMPMLLKQILPRNFVFSGRNRLFLGLACLLLILLVASAVTAMNKQQATKRQQQFQEVSNRAEQKLAEGEALLPLNKNLARENLSEAKRIIDEEIEQFPESTSERKELDLLGKRIEETLATAAQINMVTPVAVGETQSKPLTYALKNNSLRYTTEVDGLLFGIDQTGIYKSTNPNQKGAAIVKNSDTWAETAGLGLYLTNLYVLDKSVKQIIKLVPSGSTAYTSSNYFIDTQEMLGNAVALTIDGNIWVLTKDGAIHKYLRGKPETFAIAGLDNPMQNPTRIQTFADTDKLYVLDNGNSRLVVLSKNGSYQSQYHANIFKNAREMQVVEKNKKIYILAEGKVWEISIQ